MSGLQYITPSDSLVVGCWLLVREVLGSIPSQGPHHTKDVNKCYQYFPCLALYIKRKTLAFSQIAILSSLRA